MHMDASTGLAGLVPKDEREQQLDLNTETSLLTTEELENLVGGNEDRLNMQQMQMKGLNSMMDVSRVLQQIKGRVSSVLSIFAFIF